MGRLLSHYYLGWTLAEQWRSHSPAEPFWLALTCFTKFLSCLVLHCGIFPPGKPVHGYHTCRYRYTDIHMYRQTHRDIATQTDIQMHRNPSGPWSNSPDPLSPMRPPVLCEEKKAGRQHTLPGALDPAGLIPLASSAPAVTF